MMKSAVVFVLFLTSVTLTASRSCDCNIDSVGCSIYYMSTVMTRSLDKVPGNVVFSPYGLWTGLIEASHIAKGMTRFQLYSILVGDWNTIYCNKHIYEEYLKNYGINNYIYHKDAAPCWWQLITYLAGRPDLTYYYITKRYGKIWYSIDFEQLELNNYYFDKYDAELRPKVVLTKSTNFVALSNARIKDKWRSPFKRLTEHEHNGKRITMMHTSGIFFNAFDKMQGTRYVFLDCEQSDLSMVLVLTDSNKSQAETSWDMLNLKVKQTTHLNVSLPKLRFKFEYSFKEDIVDATNNQSTGKFDFSTGDFSGANGINAPLNQVVQKAVVSIDEEGVMFESYTFLVADTTLVPPSVQQLKSSEGEKSFMFYLIYREMVVAQGRIADPST